jgi:hypothetical protein
MPRIFEIDRPYPLQIVFQARGMQQLQALADHDDPPLRSDHMRASLRSSFSVQPRVAASWNMAWNSVESIVGTFSATHFWLNRCGTWKIAMRRP